MMCRRWSMQRAVGRPSEFSEALPKAFYGHAVAIRPSSQGKIFSLIDQEGRFSSVVQLFFSESPAHIARFVVAIVINAVDRVFWRWSRPHIAQEGGERVAPRVTNANAASAVMMKKWRRRVMTPVFHIGPSTKLRCFCDHVRSSRWQATGESVEDRTPARYYASVQNRVQAHNLFSATIAAASNHTPAAIAWFRGKNRQSAEFLKKRNRPKVAARHTVLFYSGDFVVQDLN